MSAAENKQTSDGNILKWQTAIYNFHARDRREQRLQDLSMRFLTAAWLPKALACGWRELDLWGAFPGSYRAALNRLDAMGLIPGLVMQTPHVLVGIRNQGADVMSRATGVISFWRREPTGYQFSRPWWEALT